MDESLCTRQMVSASRLATDNTVMLSNILPFSFVMGMVLVTITCEGTRSEGLSVKRDKEDRAQRRFARWCS